jgi:pyrimidine 5'-nucleotidase
VPIEHKIHSDPDLPDLLDSIKIPKYIFTNASIDHAERVLEHLGIETCFDEIIDIIRLDYANKPDPLAYRRALEIVGNPDPASCVLLDDSLKNLQAGSRIGFTTVQVGIYQDAGYLPDHQIATIHELFEVLPELKNSRDPSEISDG